MTRRFLVLRALRAFVVLFLGWSVSLFSVGLLPAARAQEQLVKRPNILLAIADDWSFGHASAYGCSWIKTPGFDRVAREGLLFSRAYTPNAKCAPSRACLLTGRNSWQLEAACNHICYFPTKFKTYAEALAEHGYFVGKTTKGWGPGVANDEAGQPRQMAGKAFERRKAEPPAKGISNSDYAGNFADFMQAVPAETPWCFWYGALEPHRGYEYGSGVAKGGKRPSDVDRVPGYWPDNETIRNDMLDYGYEVEHFDRHLTKMLDLLAERGQLDNTLVVVTSDHGMPFPRAKGNAYEASNHVPLAIMWQGGIKQPGRVVNDYVSFVDLAPTFLAAAGLAWSEAGLLPTAGRSLLDIFRGETSKDSPRDHVLIGMERHDIGRPHDWGYPIRGIVKDDMLYLHNFEPTRWPACNPETGYLNCDGSPTKTVVLAGRTDPQLQRHWQACFGKRPAEELYDVKRDPDCLHNLANDPQRQALKQQLQDQLFSRLKKQQDPRMFGQGSVFEEYPYADAGLRGFYERYMSGEKLTAGWVNASDFASAPLDDATGRK
jgi:N-sulfoglucosamine sulfohydrolase